MSLAKTRFVPSTRAGPSMNAGRDESRIAVPASNDLHSPSPKPRKQSPHPRSNQTKASQVPPRSYGFQFKLPGDLSSVRSHYFEGRRSMRTNGIGDFNWMRYTELGPVTYIGADVVPSLIARNEQRYGRDDREFMVLDITKSVIPRVSVILSRDCFAHLSFRNIHSAIAVSSVATRSIFLLPHTQVCENTETYPPVRDAM
jgi:hypothetical protein